MTAAAGPRTRLRRHPERSVDTDADRAAILAAGLVAHVGVVIDGEPLVIPLLYHHDGDQLFVHGSRLSRLMRHLVAGAPVCVTVTIVDGLVASRSAFTHSANYRSVVIFGTGEEVRDPERKREVLAAMTGRYFPGRRVGRDYHPATANELAITTVVAIRIDEMSAKQRTGGPLGKLDADPDGPMWAGVIDVGGRGGGCPAAA